MRVFFGIMLIITALGLASCDDAGQGSFDMPDATSVIETKTSASPAQTNTAAAETQPEAKTSAPVETTSVSIIIEPITVIIAETTSVIAETAVSAETTAASVETTTAAETTSVIDTPIIPPPVSLPDSETAVPQPTTVIEPATAVEKTTPEPPAASADTEIKVGTYIVKDPQNARGISEKKFGYAFGAAKDGKPHSISVNNQAAFDKMADVEALALDNISEDKRMYLTFDCGYEYNNLTDSILDTLKEKNVQAAFFVTLPYLKKNPDKVQRMIDERHIVGNHSNTHPVFPDISREKMAEEIYAVDEYMQEHFDYHSPYFRFPTGAYSENSLELVTSVGYRSIFWSIAYADYDTENQNGYDKAYKTVTGRFHPGAVILLHAISQDNADILGAVIDEAHAQGYSFKTLDEYAW